MQDIVKAEKKRVKKLPFADRRQYMQLPNIYMTKFAFLLYGQIKED